MSGPTDPRDVPSGAPEHPVEKPVFVIVSLCVFAAITIAFASGAVMAWLAMPMLGPLVGVLLALTGAFGGVTVSQLWALLIAEEITTTRETRYGPTTVDFMDGGKISGDGVSKTWSAMIIPRNDAPARFLLGTAILQVVAGIGLLLAGQIDPVGTGVMCLVGFWMWRWSRGIRRSSYGR